MVNPFPIPRNSSTWNHLFFGTIILLVLIVISRVNFLLFHILAEFFSIVVAWALFMLVWNTRKIARNDALFGLAIGYFCVGCVDLFHTLSYKGMGIFSAHWGANLPTQLWLVGRFLEMMALILFAFNTGKEHGRFTTLWGWFVLTALFLATIFLGIFPTAYIEGTGMTPFKIFSEYLVCLLLALTLCIVYTKRKLLPNTVLYPIAGSIILTICSEIAFTFYVGVYDASNILGHFLKIISFYLIYLAFIRANLTTPYSNLYSSLRGTQMRHHHFINSSLAGIWWANLLEPMPLDLEKKEQVAWLVKNAVIKECNSTFARLMGLNSSAELKGAALSSFLGNSTESFHNLLEHFIDSGHNLGGAEMKHTIHGCEQRWALTSISSEKSESSLLTLMGSTIDITEKKRLQLINDAKLRLVDFAPAHNVHELLRFFLDETEALTDSHIGFFHFVDNDQKTLLLQTWSTNTVQTICDIESAKRMHYPIDQAGVWVDCVARKEPVIHNDYENLTHKKGLPEGHAPVIRELVVPVLRQNTVKAILGVGNKRSPYNEEDIKIVQEFADAAWETVVGRQAEIELQQTLDNLEQTVLDRTSQLNTTIAELNTIFQTSHVGILVVQGGQTLRKWNPRLAEILGYKESDDLSTLSMRDILLTEQDYNAFTARYHQPLLDGKVFQIEHKLKRRDGSPVWCLLSGKALEQETPADLDRSVVWMIDDITSRKESEQHLQDLTLKLKASQMLGKSGWWEYDIGTGRVIWPEETRKLFGLDNQKKDLYYEDLLELIPIAYHEYHNRQLKEVLNKGVAVFEYPVVLADGSKRWFWALGETEYGEKGEPVRVFGTVQDLTDRVDTDEMLQIQNQIINQTHDSIISVDLYGNITSWNQGSEKLFQYKQHEIVDQHISRLYPADARQFLEDNIIPTVLKNGDYEYEIELKRKDGSYFDAHVSLSLLRDNKGEIVGITGYSLDISERKRVEKKLIYYEQLASSIEDMLLLVDKDLHILQVNEAFADAFGKSRDEVIGLSLEKLLGRELFSTTKPSLEDCLNGHSSIQERWVKFPNREMGYFQTVRYPMTDESGKVYAISNVTHNLTALRAIQDKLTRMNTALRRANQDLDQYAYVVSHDLQSPLRAIHNYANFIREDLDESQLTEEINLYLHNLAGAVEESKELVSDLLQLSRIGRKEKEIEEIDLGVIVQPTLERMGQEANAVIEFPAKWPRFQTNPPLMRQIVVNLVSNGIKFNSSEEKRISIQWQETIMGHIELRISDNGIGIEEKYQEQIFKVFQRLHTKKEYPGTGIGLAIVQKAVEALGGTVSLQSTPQAGTTFTVLLLQPPTLDNTYSDEEPQ